jgi:sRNA-binding carbon storage regulator CsrA
MLVLTRETGESIVLGGRTFVSVAMIGDRFVDLCVQPPAPARRRIVTVATNELVPIADGAHGIVVRIDAASGKARLGFDVPDDLTIERGEFRQDPIA